MMKLISKSRFAFEIGAMKAKQKLSRVRAACTLGLLVAGAASLPAHADIYVIANEALSVKVEDIKGIFTGEKTLADAVKLAPVDNESAKAEFLKSVLQLNGARYESVWTMKSFRDGVNPPPSKPSDQDVVAFVKATKGGIGYVSGAPPAGVVVLKKF